jgi:hypothetical protein
MTGNSGFYLTVYMFMVIQTLTHHVRTAFGDSEVTYGPHSYNGQHPNQGILQGNGAAMVTWTAVSSVIVFAMRSQGFGYNSFSALTRKALQILCVEFVDDTDLVHSGSSNQTLGTQVATEMQDMLDLWDGLLRATGGALEKQKSYWYMLDYHQRDGKWKYKPPNAVPNELLLFNDETGLKEAIPKLSAHTAKKALGIFSRPDGKMYDEVRFLKSKAKLWADNLRVNRIGKEDAWYCLNSTIMKTIKDPLVATSLTAKQCKAIMSPMLTAGLHSIGIQRNLPQVLVYGPIQYQGLGVRDPWATQLIEHLHCILRHCTRDTIMGQLINANLENLTLELGSSLTKTWRDLSSTPLTLKGPLTLPTAQRENDTFLMEAFLQMDLSIDDLISLNDVRMFKHVLRLSDVFG